MIIRSGRWTVLFLAAVAGLIFSQAGCKDALAPESSSTHTDVFPLAVGAQWVYDYKYFGEEMSMPSYTTHSMWQQGTITFSILNVAEEMSQWRWTVRERDSLHYTDTTSDYYYGVIPGPDSTVIREFTFSMLEGKDQLHHLTATSCSLIWLSPIYGQKNVVLSRYVPGSVESSLIYHSDTSYNVQAPFFWHGDSLLFLPGKGLVRYTSGWISGAMSYYNRTSYWATLRQYAPAQGLSLVRTKNRMSGN